MKPQQARSRDTLDRILDAAEALIGERGFDATSVADVVDRADASVSSFYARFEDKDRLLLAIHDRFLAQTILAIDAATQPELWAKAETPDLVAALAEGVTRTLLARAPLVRAFALRGGADPVFRGEAVRVGQHLVDRVGTLLIPRLRELDHPSPARAVDFAVKQLIAIVQQIALFGEGGFTGRAITTDELVREARSSMAAYLGVRAPKKTAKRRRNR